MGDGADYLISGLAGAAEGFFSNQAAANKEAKLQAENERLAKILLMKEDRITAREMAKEKSRQTFEGKQQGDKQTFEMSKLDKEQGFKQKESQAKRAAEVFDDGNKEEFDRWKVGKESENRLAVANISAGAKGKRSGMTEMQEYKLESDLAKLEDEGVSDINVNRINTIKAQLGQPVYEKVETSKGQEGNFLGIGKKEPTYEYRLKTGASGSADSSSTSAGKIDPMDTIGAAMAGKASRTKPGANADVKEQPLPLGGVDKNDNGVGVDQSSYTQPQQPAARVVARSPQRQPDLPPTTPARPAETDALPVISTNNGMKTDELSRALIRDPASVDTDAVIAQIEKGKIDLSKLNKTSLENLSELLDRKYDRRSKMLQEEVAFALQSAG